MNRLNKIILHCKHFINYVYYLCHSVIRNTYPYKLIGEKVNSERECVVIYKVVGANKTYEIKLADLLNHKIHVERFHPLDGCVLGLLAFEEILNDVPDNLRNEKYQSIKQAMFDSGCNAYLFHQYSNNNHQEVTLPNFLGQTSISNFYPFRLVDWKHCSIEKETYIVYTIFGKRDGYERKLSDVLANKQIISKFHPTAAVKLGFVYLGDMINGLAADAVTLKTKQLKNKLLHL